jgi:large subunit ribosomal protein L24
MKIHTGDIVVINTGKDKGKQGTVLRVLETKNRVVVEGINMRIRHIKKTQQSAGQRISYEASIHASNVQILDPKTKKPTRIGYKVDAKTGQKTRIAKASGEAIIKAVTKAAKTSTKKDPAAGVPARETKEKKSDTSAMPAKSSFWKRGEKGSGKVDGGAAGADNTPNVIQTAHRAQGG